MRLFQNPIRKWGIFLGTLTLWLVIHSALVLNFANNHPLTSADWAVILGNQVYPNGQISPPLQARLNLGLDLWETRKVSHLLVSGATGWEGVNEALAMRRYLLEKGVPDSVIVVDTLRRNSWATALATSDMVPSDEEVIIVSHEFHLLRCHWAFRQHGVRVKGVAGVPFFESPRQFYGLIREWPAFYYYLLVYGLK